MIYALKHKNLSVAVIEIKNRSAINMLIGKQYEEHLPLPLKRILNHSDEFVERQTASYYIVNDSGCWLFDEWLSNREIPVNRDGWEMYSKKNIDRTKIMLENNAISFTDCYWLQPEHDTEMWEDVYARIYGRTDTMQVVINDGTRMYRGANTTLGGQLEKFWYIDTEYGKESLKLCKKTISSMDVSNAREVIASMIYQAQEYKYFCIYELVKNSHNEVVGCKCDAFTDVEHELISAYDLLEQYNWTQQQDVYEKIIELAGEEGANINEVSDYLDFQMIVDFLIHNRDRHQGNIGFIRNPDTLKIIAPAPVYDSGSSQYLEKAQPEHGIEVKVNGLYHTFGECLSHVTNWNVIDLNKLPSRMELEAIYCQCGNISNERREMLLDIYDENVLYVQQRQLQHEELQTMISEQMNSAEQQIEKELEF